MPAHTLNASGAPAHAATDTHRHPAPWRAVLAASVGNALEYYDLLIYGYFAITIGKLFFPTGDAWSSDRKSTRLNSSHIQKSRMPSSA